jgi:hypothetical protein
VKKGLDRNLIGRDQIYLLSFCYGGKKFRGKSDVSVTNKATNSFHISFIYFQEYKNYGGSNLEQSSRNGTNIPSQRKKNRRMVFG